MCLIKGLIFSKYCARKETCFLLLEMSPVLYGNFIRLFYWSILTYFYTIISYPASDPQKSVSEIHHQYQPFDNDANVMRLVKVINAYIMIANILL